ncbi:hypothetical protein CC80DRAFT_543077 [Byssothecium circinans]|uniref:C3H1-type domain-containing protein n=1 Tax=Byssothecium circinans TaxID=147558 RepID=A0A6A5UA10_9PLEO|nr:hypothetical protein CC80DRAFT_543077 [Byssothecium circinans]
MDHYQPTRPVPSYDSSPHPEYNSSSGPRNRARDRSPIDDRRVYRSRSRQRVPRQQSDPATRHGKDALQQIDVTLPKNFPKPLTCFFWFTNGRCSKRDQDCAYAHWDTGHLAGSPITVSAGSGAGSVAGKKARDLACDTYRPASEDLKTREAALKCREEELERKEKEIAVSKEVLEDLIKAKEAELQSREKEAVGHNTSAPEWVCAKCAGDCLF